MSNIIRSVSTSPKWTKQNQKFRVEGNPSSFQQLLAKIASKNDAHKYNPKIKDEAAEKALNRFEEISLKPKKVRNVNLKMQHQSASDKQTEYKKNPSETEVMPADLILPLIQNDIKNTDFLLNSNPYLCQKNSINQFIPMTDLINQLVSQISVYACDTENSKALKLIFNQETLPATIVNIQQTPNGWKLDFTTSSAFSYRQIDQHLDYLKQRFERRRLGVISTHINLFNPLLESTKEEHEN